MIALTNVVRSVLPNLGRLCAYAYSESLRPVQAEQADRETIQAAVNLMKHISSYSNIITNISRISIIALLTPSLVLGAVVAKKICGNIFAASSSSYFSNFDSLIKTISTGILFADVIVCGWAIEEIIKTCTDKSPEETNRRQLDILNNQQFINYLLTNQTNPSFENLEELFRDFLATSN